MSCNGTSTGTDGEMTCSSLAPGEYTITETQISAADGTYSFSGVAPGTYYVTEGSTAGWVQTLPESDGARTVVVEPGDTSVSIDPFLNAPLTDLQVTVSPQTAYSFGSISCTKDGNAVHGNGDAAGTDVAGSAGSPVDDDVWSADDLEEGTYACAVTIVDP